MDPDFTAQLTLIGYAILGAILIAWQALRAECGWQAWILYATERIYIPLMFHWRSNRRCPFPARGPAVIIANHRSPVDPLLLWMNHHLGEHGRKPIRILSFLTAREYSEVPVVSWICRVTRIIPVDRGRADMTAVRQAYHRLQEGDLIGIFPEGRINLGQGLLKGNAGVAWLVLRAKVPVYPVFIHNAPGGESMVEPFYRFSRVKVIYGDPIDLSAYYDRPKSHAVLNEVTNLLMQRLAALGGVPYETTEAAKEPSPQHV